MMLATLTSLGFAMPPTRPSSLPLMKCRMWETPPNWAQYTDPFEPTWTYDPNFPPMVLLNLEALPSSNSAQAAADRVATIADRYGDLIFSTGGTNGTALRAGFDADLAISLLNFGGDYKQSSTNPTRFIVPDENTDLVYTPADGSNSAYEHPEYHLWQGTGIEAAKTWMAGTNGFLEKLEAKVSNSLLAALPTRFIGDTEIPSQPFLAGHGDVVPADRANQTRRLRAMIDDARASTVGSAGEYKIPYKSSDGLTLETWFTRATSKFSPSIFPNGSTEPWLDGTNLNLDQDKNLGQDENRQFGLFYERLWQMQIDGALKYALMDPLASRTGWTNTKVSNYAFVQTDDDFETDSSVSTAGSLPVKSNVSRVRGGPAFEYGWHFERTNITAPAALQATRVNYIGTKEIRNEGAATVGAWTSAGFRKLYSGESGLLHLSAPGMYTGDPVHKRWDVYAAPTASPFQPYSETIGQSGTPNAPLESDTEAVVRLFRYNLESVLYSGKANTSTESITPWLSMPDIDHDQELNHCNEETNNGPFINVTDELVRRKLQLCYQFNIQESNIFGLKTGFCRERIEDNCESIVGYDCDSGDADAWQRLQTIYYQVMNPWVEDAGIFRGYDFVDNSSPNNPETLRNAVRNTVGDVVTWDVGSDILNNGGSHAGLEVTIAGFAPQTPQPDSVLETLRITLETEHFFGETTPDQIAGEIRIFVRTTSNPSGSWQTLNITDYDSHTSLSDPRRGKYGAWSPDRSVRRMFEFFVYPDQIVDSNGRMKLIFLEAAHDGTTGQTSDETFVTRFDYVHAMLIPNVIVAEGMLARGYDPAADQNIDGEVNSLDIAQFALDYIDEVGAADANSDGEVTPADVDAFIDIHTANQQ